MRKRKVMSKPQPAREYTFTSDMCRQVFNRVLADMGDMPLSPGEKVYATFGSDGSLYVKVAG